MAVRHIGITMHLYYTMILLYLRTIIVALFFLFLPFLISTIITFFTLVEVPVILLSIFAITSLLFFLVIVHLNSTLEIFIEATWYEAYQACKKEDAVWDADHGSGHDDHGGHDEHGHDSGHDDHGGHGHH